MNKATAQKLVDHHTECGNHEFIRQKRTDNEKTTVTYKCKKCGARIEPVEDVNVQ